LEDCSNATSLSTKSVQRTSQFISIRLLLIGAVRNAEDQCQYQSERVLHDNAGIHYSPVVILFFPTSNEESVVAKWLVTVDSEIGIHTVLYAVAGTCVRALL
jgi:hypothetical protein